MSTEKLLLEHFYYGEQVRGGKIQGDPIILARSTGITETLAKQIMKRVTLPPLIQSENASWALVKGRHRDFPFLLIQAQIGEAGQITLHYIVVPSNILKLFAGNIRLLKDVVKDKLPDFYWPDPRLPLLELPQAEHPTEEAQIDAILEFMMTAKNRFKIIETLLASIIQGTQLIVQDAPASFSKRTMFVQGLLSLLPPSARFGVTFTTHSLPSSDIDTQIRFCNGDLSPEDAIIFNWKEAKVSGETIKDDYSRFIISQLRLDIGLVIKHNTVVAAIAGWRLNQGDKLADALGYASNRLRTDEGVRNSQPVNKNEVGKILSEDPTLPDELRPFYAEHLVKFSLAMEDMQYCTAVAPLLVGNDQLEQSIMQQMNGALRDNLAWLIHETLLAWVSHPEGPKLARWVELTHEAIVSYLTELIEDKDIDAINALLKKMQLATVDTDLMQIIPHLVDMIRPFYAQDPQVAKNLFLVAIRHLDTSSFAQVMNTVAFRDNLPAQIRRVWSIISTGATHSAPSELFVKTARDFGEEWENTILIRFSEFACEANHFSILDAPALAALLALAQSPDGDHYKTQLLSIVHAVEGFALTEIASPGPTHLLQIHLAVGDYTGLAQQIRNQSRTLYAEDNLSQYLKVVEKLFTETPIPIEQIETVLQTLSQNGIKAAPYVVAATSAIKHYPQATSLDTVAEQISSELQETPYVIESTPPGIVFSLMRRYFRRKDIDGILRMADLLPVSAFHAGTSGVKVIVAAYKELSRSKKTHSTGLKMLRAYIRLQRDDKTTRKLIAYLIKELGKDIKRPLEVTYIINSFMGGSDILPYANDVHITVQFLHDVVALYEGKRIPPVTDLRNALVTIAGGAGKRERHELADNLLAMAKSAISLGKQYREARPRNEERHIDALLKQETDPKSSLDIFWVMSGFFGRLSQLPLKLDKVGYPLENRTLADVMNEVGVATALLDSSEKTFQKHPINLTTDEICTELGDLRNAIPYEDRIEILRTLARDLQQLIALLIKIEADGDAKALDNSGLARKISSGRYTPQNTLECLRYMYAFFSA